MRLTNSTYGAHQDVWETGGQRMEKYRHELGLDQNQLHLIIMTLHLKAFSCGYNSWSFT